MSGEPLDNSKADKKEKIVINLDAEKIKSVSNTYSLYTSMEVEATEKTTHNVESKSFHSNIRNKDVESIKSLKPELQKPIKKLLSTVSKEQVQKLINPTEEQKGRLFNKKGSNTFSDLSEQEKAILMRKMDDWKVNEEIAEINATVAVSWINNVSSPQTANPGTNKLNASNTNKLNDNK
ncbi:MAG: hypothetical protein H7263_18280 [Candidatus Sericytochromatia bacterium]|nr:hypothetical protein [Candidatus Sericytochromatia bacterium]